jgi:hypothetical protein
VGISSRENCHRQREHPPGGDAEHRHQVGQPFGGLAKMYVERLVIGVPAPWVGSTSRAGSRRPPWRANGHNSAMASPKKPPADEGPRYGSCAWCGDTAPWSVRWQLHFCEDCRELLAGRTSPANLDRYPGLAERLNWKR